MLKLSLLGPKNIVSKTGSGKRHSWGHFLLLKEASSTTQKTMLIGKKKNLFEFLKKSFLLFTF